LPSTDPELVILGGALAGIALKEIAHSGTVCQEAVTRTLILTLLVMTMVATVVLAQAADEHRGQGYVFFGPGAASGGGTLGTVHFGGGGEGLLYKGIGVGGELGFLAPNQRFSDGLAVLSLNGSYHFLPHQRTGKVAPFVTGGYSLFFRSGSANLYNFGGGIHYWFRERMGLRLEFRDHVLPTPGGPSVHYWGFRMGLAFR